MCLCASNSLLVYLPGLLACLFQHLGLFLMQVVSILFSGDKQLKTGKSGKHKEIKRIQAGTKKMKLRTVFEKLFKLKT